MISKLIDFQFPAVYFPLLLNISLRIPLIKNPKTFFSSFVWMNICVSVIFAVRPRFLKIQNNTLVFLVFFVFFCGVIEPFEIR